MREPKFNLSQDISEQRSITDKNYNKSIVQISENEIKLHKEFIKKELKKNYY